jgi:hypothetical protein
MTDDAGLTSYLEHLDDTGGHYAPMIPALTPFLDGGKLLDGARIGARLLPAARFLGTAGLGASAFILGWKIGSPIGGFFYKKITEDVGNASGGSYNLFWNFYASTSPVANATFWPTLPTTDTWVLCGANGTCDATIWFSPLSNDMGTTTNTNAINVANTVGAHKLSGAPAGLNAYRIYLTEAEMQSLIGYAPSNLTEYNSLSHATPWNPPSGAPNGTDLGNARAKLGNPVTGGNPSTGYHDGSGNPLTPQQVVTQVDTNCALDSSYCPGGINDPAGPGGVLESMFTMPNCIDLTVTACSTALTAAGWVGPLTTITLPATTAQLTHPAGAIVSANYSAGVTLNVGVAITLTRNPDPLPIALPHPLIGETYLDYVTRLQDLGWLGAYTTLELDADTGNVSLGPDAPVRVHVHTVATPTAETVLSPTTWPTPEPRIDRDSDIEIEVNPHDFPPVDGGAGGGSCDCPPIDLTPLTTTHASDKFPFGVFSYFGTVLGWFNVTPVPPGFDIAVTAVGGDHYTGNLAAFSPYMAIVRTLLSWVMWIGAIWFVATRMLGFTSSGDVGEAADDGSVV